MIIKVLVIDHDESIAALLMSCLQTEGYHVMKSTQAQEAVSLFLKEKSELVILDLQLPGKAALKVLETIRKTKHGRTIPIIILAGKTAHTEQIELALKSKYHTTAFITKPFRISTLLQTVDKVLEGVPTVPPEVPVRLPVVEERGRSKVKIELEEPAEKEEIHGPEYLELIEPEAVDSAFGDDTFTGGEGTIVLPSDEPEKVATGPSKEPKNHILIVDDEVMILKILTKILESAGYKVTATHKSTEAFRLTSEFKPDLVISDIMMPQLDGYALCRLIKSKEQLKQTKVMLLTAKNLGQDKGQGFKSGADFFMQKPINRDKILSVVQNLLTAS